LFGIAVAGLGLGSMETFALAGSPAVESRIVVDGPTADGERKAIAEAVRLLARLPELVAVIDAEQAKPDVKATLLRLDAFTIKESRVVYLVRQSALLRGAVQRREFHTFALASVIWHEMAHAEGADDARRGDVSSRCGRRSSVTSASTKSPHCAISWHSPNGPTLSSSPPVRQAGR
jgi:hypothetical protein